MRQSRLFGILSLALFLAASLDTFAAGLPEWARKGDSYMNRKRTNTSYVFKVFKTEDQYLSRLQEGRFYPLLQYLGEKYQADPAAMALDSLVTEPGEPQTYRIVFSEGGRDAVVFARRVDVYSAVDRNVEMNPVFEYYQLYAVSEKNEDVLFDHFEKSERSRTKAAVMSIVPGLGQLYKGDTFKGYALLGSEIALGAAALSFNSRSTRFRDIRETGAAQPASYQSKEKGMRKLRNITLGAMAGIWAFGLYDAMTRESLPNILVSAPDGRTLTVAPASESAGVALVYHF